MVNVIIKNLKEVDEAVRDEVEKICIEKAEFFKELFKKYDKELTLEIIFNHSSSTYNVSAAIELKSKKVLIAEEGKDVLKVTTQLLNEFKKSRKTPIRT